MPYSIEYAVGALRQVSLRREGTTLDASTFSVVAAAASLLVVLLTAANCLQHRSRSMPSRSL